MSNSRDKKGSQGNDYHENGYYFPEGNYSILMKTKGFPKKLRQEYEIEEVEKYWLAGIVDEKEYQDRYNGIWYNLIFPNNHKGWIPEDVINEYINTPFKDGEIDVIYKPSKYYFAHCLIYIPRYSSHDIEYLFYYKDIKQFHSELINAAFKLKEQMVDTYYEYYTKGDYVYDGFNSKEMKFVESFKNRGLRDFEIIRELIEMRIERLKKKINNNQGDINDIKNWIDLYNDYHESTLYMLHYEAPELKIWIGDSYTFAMHFFDNLAYKSHIRNEKSINKLIPLHEVFKKYYELTSINSWPQNEFIFKKFIDWFEKYKNMTYKY